MTSKSDETISKLIESMSTAQHENRTTEILKLLVEFFEKNDINPVEAILAMTFALGSTVGIILRDYPLLLPATLEMVYRTIAIAAKQTTKM